MDSINKSFTYTADITVDRAHEEMDFSNDALIRDVTRDKYLQEGEDFTDMNLRVANAIMGPATEGAVMAYTAMEKGIWMPAGRILSGAGTAKVVTLMNCFVNQKLEDSMVSIMDGVKRVAISLQMSGGIGTDFSPLRPRNARLKRTGAGAKASGPIPFMHQYNATSLTVKSAGDRRGAMMGTLCDTHPDLPAFIVAKQTKGALEQFNVSILVSDAFMHCVAMDEDWLLYHQVPPIGDRPAALVDLDFEDSDGVQQYVYSVWRARELWELITRNTYDWSEPGVIYIDRVNELNNLYYCEDIRCTNPCGEQPLPYDGACDLGAINLMRLVHSPFTRHAEIDFDTLRLVAGLGLEFLDNVIDVTAYPFPEQEAEQRNKRRTGIGISGLATMFSQMGIRYGSSRSVAVAETVMQHIAVAAYERSAQLAQQKGAFPFFDKDKYLKAAFIQKLPKRTQEMIGDLGIRNGVLLTIAPTGTTTVAFGNGSSGLEPDFAHIYNRKVHQADDSWKTYENVKSYGLKLYEHVHGLEITKKNLDTLPDYMITSQDPGMSISDHLRIQAACQKWVDASVSKTINIPTETPYEEFADVYLQAYQMGAKGCTTYRYSEVRGSILDTGEPKKATQAEPVKEVIKQRPDVLTGATYKIKWPSWSAAIYVTINHDEDNRPFEVFILSKDARHQEWITALTLMISAIFRKGGDISFVPKELKQIHSTHDSAWANQKHYPSLVARIADVIEFHLTKTGIIHDPEMELQAVEGYTHEAVTTTTNTSSAVGGEGGQSVKGEKCPECTVPAMIRSEGCKKCTNCGYSSCG